MGPRWFVAGAAAMLLLGGLLFASFPTSAQQATVVSIDAPSNVTSGANFTATVDVDQITDFDSASYDVVFDNAVLMLVSVANGSIGGTTIPVTNSPGSASPSRVVQNVPGLSGVTGSGTLITITFNATGADGTSSDIELTSLVLGDNSAQLIQTTFQSDTVVVGTPATATPTATATTVPPTATATTVPGEATATPTNTPTNTPTATATVISEDLESIEVTPADTLIEVGDTQQYTATGTFLDDTTQDITADVTWTSTGDNAATISDAGLATGQNSGTDTITATFDEVVGTAILRVDPAPQAAPKSTPAPATPTPAPLPASTPVPASGATQSYVTPQEDARVTAPGDKATLDIPSGALSVPAFVTVRSQTTADVPDAPAGFELGADIVEISFADTSGNEIVGLTLTKAATVEFPITVSQFLDAGPGGLVILRAESGGDEWTSLPTDVDPVAKTASALVTSFSSFTLGTGSAPVAIATEVAPAATSEPVVAAATATAIAPATGGAAPTSGMLLALSLLGLAAIAGGGSYLVIRRRSESI